MRLVRQHDQARGATVAAQRFVKFARLQRCGSRIGVIGAVDDEQRRLQLVSKEER